MTKALPLTDHQVKRLEAFQPVEPWEYRAKVVGLLCLDGLKLAEVMRLVLPDANLELGIVALEEELVPLSLPTVEAIRAWLDIRPQKGMEQSLITGFHPGLGQRIKREKPLHFDVARWTESVLGVRVTTHSLHATFYHRLMQSMPGATPGELHVATGRSESWLSYWRISCQAEESTKS